jgi:agmatinase
VSVAVRDVCAEEFAASEASGGRIVPFYDADLKRRLLAGEPFAVLADEVAASLPPNVYVSFDIDGLEPSLCPNTGTPVPGGLSFEQAEAVLAAVVRSGRRIVGFDLCEVAPAPAARGSAGEWDANVGARMLFKLIGYALASRAGHPS